MDEIRKRARELMKGVCRLCPVCDGRACAGEVPGMGGAGTGAGFRANVDSLARVRLKMRLIHDVTSPDTAIDFFGQRLDLPVLAAPMGGVEFNLGGGLSEEDYFEAVLGGCVDAGTRGGTADGAPDYIHQAAFKVIAGLGGAGIPFIKPWADEELLRKLDGAQAAGAKVVGIDIDAVGLITLSLMGRPVTPRPAPALGKIIGRYPLKFILKGIMTPEDAAAAFDAGAAGIAVGNHGGRVLDHTPGTAEVLQSIADRVRGRGMILADGGVRCGADVIKMIALGAQAVMIGRPFAWAAIGGGRQGVVKYLGQIRSELLSAMILTGCADVASIHGGVIV
jgi:4-hydroxymandelate oxidase